MKQLAALIAGLTVFVVVSYVVLTAEPWKSADEKLADAVSRWDLAAARALLEKGARPEGVAGRSRPPLVDATAHGDPELVRLLLDHGADPNRQDGDRETALCRAVRERRSDVALALVAKGADPGIACGTYHPASALQALAGEPDFASPELIERLVKAASPAAIAVKDEYGRTPLARAVGGEPTERRAVLVRALLKAGAAPDFEALASARAEYLAPMLDAGASPTTASPDGKRSLILVAVYRGDLEAVELLLARGVKVNTGAPEAIAPFLAAIGRGQTKIVAALLAHGASPDVQYEEGDARPLEEAVAAGQPEIVALLLEKGARPELCPDLIDEVLRRFDPEHAPAEAEPREDLAEAPPPARPAKAIKLPDDIAGKLAVLAKEARSRRDSREAAERESAVRAASERRERDADARLAREAARNAEKETKRREVEKERELKKMMHGGK